MREPAIINAGFPESKVLQRDSVLLEWNLRSTRFPHLVPRKVFAMRVALTLVVVFTCIVIAVFSVRTGHTQPLDQQPARYDGGGLNPSDQLIALSSDADKLNQQVTLIDPRGRVMSVYHINRQTGEITLKGVRKFDWDLQMEDFNGVSPSPREIRSLLQQR